jgi:hypothetical protein
MSVGCLPEHTQDRINMIRGTGKQIKSVRALTSYRRSCCVPQAGAGRASRLRGRRGRSGQGGWPPARAPSWRPWCGSAIRLHWLDLEGGGAGEGCLPAVKSESFITPDLINQRKC